LADNLLEDVDLKLTLNYLERLIFVVVCHNIREHINIKRK
jgi:hypothetical protein